MRTLPVVVVYLADAVRAAQVAERLEAEGYHPLLITSSDQLYDILNRERVDLVVLENLLRGFLTGLEILERLYDDLLRPPTLLLAEPTPDHQRRAKKLGLQPLLPPTSSTAEICAQVGQTMERAARSHLEIPPPARRLVRDVDCVRPLPQLLIKLSGTLHSGEISPDELARDISVDSRVTAELLRLANSSALGRAHKTTNLHDAVNFLGIKRTVSLVLSAGLMKAQSHLLGQLSRQTRQWYNYRSVLIGSTSAAFARNLEIVSAETAYILGLLQDVGILVLAHAHGDRYLGLLERVREIPLLCLEHLELEDLEMTHAQVSAALLQKWSLPESLVSLVLHHHDTGNEERSELETAFLRVMRVGEAVANLADRRSSQRFQALNRRLSFYGTKRADACKLSLSEGVARMVESSQLFNVPLPSEEVLEQFVDELNSHARYNEPAEEPALNELPPGTEEMEMLDVAAEGPTGVLPPEDRPPTILIIEDEPQVVKMIRHFIAPLGIQVLDCDGLASAQRLAPQVDLIFCDVHLGDENGIDVIRVLRQEGYRGPVLIVSADRMRETVQQSIEVGISGYLIKPFSKSLLVEKLRQHLALGEMVDVAPTCTPRQSVPLAH